MSVKYNAKFKEIQKLITKLLENIKEASEISLQAYETNNIPLFDTVEKRLANIEPLGNIVDNEIIKTFAMFRPEANELRTLVSYLKMTNEIVRIGIGFKKYAHRMAEHCAGDCDFGAISKTIIKLNKSSVNSLTYIFECFKDMDACNVEDFYTKVMVEESINDDLFSIIEKEIMNLIISEKELAVEYVKVLATLRKLERSSDRSVTIASLMLYAKNGGTFQLYN